MNLQININKHDLSIMVRPRILLIHKYYSTVCSIFGKCGINNIAHRMCHRHIDIEHRRRTSLEIITEEGLNKV